MSVEIYVHGFSEGQPGGLTLEDVTRQFGSDVKPDDGLIRLQYDDRNSCELSLIEEHGTVTQLTVFRPCDHDRLYASLFELLRTGPYVAFTPGSQPIVVNESVIAAMPTEMIDSFTTMGCDPGVNATYGPVRSNSNNEA